jgi:hypothetical protein
VVLVHDVFFISMADAYLRGWSPPKSPNRLMTPAA